MMLEKIKLNIKFIERFADTEPRSLENRFMFIGLLGLMLAIVFYMLNFVEFRGYNFLRGISWLSFAIGSFPYSIRATKSITLLLFHRSLPVKVEGVSGLFFASAAIFWKLRKPIISGCLACLGSVVGSCEIYHAIRGVHPVNELLYVYRGEQTMDQAKYHIFNLERDYSAMDAPPYLQERMEVLSYENSKLSVDNLKKDAMIKDLEQEIDKIAKKRK